MHTESYIIEGCVKNRRREQQLLYKQFAAPMLVLCMRYCKNREEAEDVLQEGFIKVFNKIATFKQSGSLEGWIRRIMINQALNFLKSKKMVFVHDDIQQLSNRLQDEPDQNTYEERFSPDQVMTAIQKLPPGYRVVFNLYVFDGFGHKEIASELNISENTSKSQLSKARKYLRKLLVP